MQLTWGIMTSRLSTRKSMWRSKSLCEHWTKRRCPDWSQQCPEHHLLGTKWEVMPSETVHQVLWLPCPLLRSSYHPTIRLHPANLCLCLPQPHKVNCTYHCPCILLFSILVSNYVWSYIALTYYLLLYYFLFLKVVWETSMVVQRLRVCLPILGMQAGSLVREKKPHMPWGD